MGQSFEIILTYLENYYRGNEKNVIVAVICLLYLLIFEKDIREKYGLPILISALTILNPLLYSYIFYKTYMYWRLFQIFSLHIIIGITIICILRRIKKDYLKLLVSISVCALIVFNGSGNVFLDCTLPEYVDKENDEKLPYGIKEICDVILQLEDNPKVITDPFFGAYCRVYSGKITQLYGRNSSGFISKMSADAKEVYDMSIVRGDMYGLLEWASNNEYDFIVLESGRVVDRSISEMFGYELIFEVGNDNYDYRLYYRNNKE